MSEPFDLIWTIEARSTFDQFQASAIKSRANREKSKKPKSSRQEGLFKQIVKCLMLLSSNPRHPGLATHEFSTMEHPYRPGDKVFEAYVQNETPGAYRLFWCYGPQKRQITVIAITPHP